MFVMMNGARLNTGIQALGLANTTYQRAFAYAQERLQLQAPCEPAANSNRPIRSPCIQLCNAC